MQKTNWHSLSIEETLLRLETSPSGLDEKEIPERLTRFGPNLLPPPRPLSPLLLFLRQFHSPLMYLVLAALSVSLALGNIFDSFFIITVILINTTVGFVQEYRGERAIESLKQLEKGSARVIRQSTQKLIPAELLVPGDILLLSAGDKVPADARLLAASGLRANEAILTGEWLPVSKDSTPSLRTDTPLAERTNTIFSGALIEEGWGQAVVVATGSESELGKVVEMLRDAREARTPLQRKLLHLARFLGLFIVVFIAFIVLVGIARGAAFQELFIASVALMVSAIPEGLLPLITVTMVVGTRRILRERALVRHLAAVETLGSVTVIATDKTGTLTEGTMEVSHIIAGRDELSRSGSTPISSRERRKELFERPHIAEALTIGALAGDAFVENPTHELEKRIIRGRPTDVALLRAALEAGLEPTSLSLQFPRIDFLPFSADRSFAASLHRKEGEGSLILFAFGAPEALLEISDRVLTQDNRSSALGEQERALILSRVLTLASRGLRILAVARRTVSSGEVRGKILELARELTFVGLVALRDPLRQDVREAITLTRAAGIKTLLLTGDHRKTAEEVLQELGIEVRHGSVLDGVELEEMPDAELRKRIERTILCSRISPRGKLRVITSLHENGEVVAMIGDGVNDAPSLRDADVGVAVASGHDAAREASDMVLLDGSFRTVVKAIEEGRVTFENIRKLFTYLLADDFSELFLFFGAMAAGLPTPLLPAHILWINLVEDSFPGIALAFEEERKDVLARPPRSPKEGIISRSMRHWFRAIFVITGIAALATFVGMYAATGDLARTRTTVFALMVVDSLVFSFILRSFRRSVFRRDIFSNRLLVGAFLVGVLLLAAALYFSPLASLMHTVPLGLQDWAVVASVSFTELLLLEWTKKIAFRS